MMFNDYKLASGHSFNVYLQYMSRKVVDTCAEQYKKFLKTKAWQKYYEYNELYDSVIVHSTNS